MEWFAYEQMQGGNTSQALEILLLNAAAYPDSPNVYDSLGEVYLASGQKDLALKNTRKALELIPSDTADPPNRRISNESPLGRALIGHKKGATVDVATPRGLAKYKIESIKSNSPKKPTKKAS